MGAPGRFERALALAREAIDAAGRAHRVAVVAFDDRADVSSRRRAVPGEARAALDALAPASAATRYAPLFDARRGARGDRPARLVVDHRSAARRLGGRDARSCVPASLGSRSRDGAALADEPGGDAMRRSDGGGGRDGPQRRGGSRVRQRARLVGRRPAGGDRAVHRAGGRDRRRAVRYRAPRPRRADRRRSTTRPAMPPTTDGFCCSTATGRARVLIVGDGANASRASTCRARCSRATATRLRRQARTAASLGAMSPPRSCAAAVVDPAAPPTASIGARARCCADFVRSGGGLLVAAAADVDAGGARDAAAWPDFSAVEQAAGGRGAGGDRPAASDLPPVRRAGREPRPGPVRLAPGRCAPTAGTSRRGSPTARRRCWSGARAAAAWCCSPRISIGGGTTFRCNPAFVPFVMEAVRHWRPARPTAPRLLVARRAAGRRAPSRASTRSATAGGSPSTSTRVRARPRR